MKWNDQFSAEADKQKKVVPNSQLIRTMSGSNARLIKKWFDAERRPRSPLWSRTPSWQWSVSRAESRSQCRCARRCLRTSLWPSRPCRASRTPRPRCSGGPPRTLGAGPHRRASGGGWCGRSFSPIGRRWEDSYYSWVAVQVIFNAATEWGGPPVPKQGATRGAKDAEAIRSLRRAACGVRRAATGNSFASFAASFAPLR